MTPSEEETARAHCGPNAFSPMYEHCEELHHVPEPSTGILLAVSMLALLVIRRLRR